MDVVVLQNEALRAVFDRATGALVELVSLRTGWRVQNRTELARTFRLWAPLPERRNNQASGDAQCLTRCERSGDGQRLTLGWTRPRSEHGGVLDLTLHVEVTLGDDGLKFATTVVNRSPLMVEAIAYPCLGDFTVPNAAEKLERIMWRDVGGNRRPLWPLFANERGYHGSDYPIQYAPFPDTPFVLYASPSQGLYVGCHEARARRLVQFCTELKPGFGEQISPDMGRWPATPTLSGQPVHVELSTIHLPFVPPGQTVQLAPIVLAPYVGTWHVGMDTYKRWRRTWFKPAPTPAWARQVHSWHQLHINSPEDELRCQYRDLVKYGEACAEKHGVAAIQLVGWNHGGQDRGNPAHDPDPRLGTWEELRDAIAAIQRLGVKLILFNKYTWADRAEPWFRQELHRYGTRDPHGDLHLHQGYHYQTPTQLSDINTRRFVPMCPLNAAWREIAGREFDKSLALGAAGMLYDECQHHGGVRYCYAPDHGHAVPAYVYDGDLPLVEELRARAAGRAPEFLFSGEACYDLEFQQYSIAYSRIFDDPHTPVQRYIDPQVGLMVAVTGYDARRTLNQCLMHRYIVSYESRQFKGRLDEFPLTLEYGKQIDALRRRYSAYLWDAEYRDTLEARVMPVSGRRAAEGADAPRGLHFPYTTFRQPDGRRAVIVTNNDDTATARVSVEFPGKTGKLATVTPESPEPRSCNGKFEVPPRSAVVVLES